MIYSYVKYPCIRSIASLIVVNNFYQVLLRMCKALQTLRISESCFINYKAHNICPMKYSNKEMLVLCSILTGLIERKLVLQSCMRSQLWGLLEMSILLTDDIVEFNMLSMEWYLDWACKQLNSNVDVKLYYRKHGDWLVSLLTARCPVSNGI